MKEIVIYKINKNDKCRCIENSSQSRFDKYWCKKRVEKLCINTCDVYQKSAGAYIVIFGNA